MFEAATTFAEQVVHFFTTATFVRIAWWLAIALPVAALLEPWAAFAHRFLWHRKVMWPLHKSHHSLRKGTGLLGWFEANDALSGVHAPLSIGLIVVAVITGPGAPGDSLFAVGAGMALFGVSYFVFHDGMVHGRIPVQFLAKVPLFRRMAEAHDVHHKRNGFPYGFFLGPQELRRAERQGRVR